MCAHCHGDQGGGDGLIAKASFANNPYDVMPAFNDGEAKRPRTDKPMTDLKEGHICHTITYMERWGIMLHKFQKKKDGRSYIIFRRICKIIKK